MTQPYVPCPCGCGSNLTSGEQAEKVRAALAALQQDETKVEDVVEAVEQAIEPATEQEEATGLKPVADVQPEEDAQPEQDPFARARVISLGPAW